MKRIVKNSNSKILKLKYPTHSKKIRELLLEEQFCFCAYTESKITSGFAVDIDHFNPLLKNTEEDNYNNWFAVSHKFNKKKSNKWINYQPILHPTTIDFEERVVYDKETALYLYKDKDIEAKNLIELLDLNNKELVDDRLNKILLLKILFSEKSIDISFLEWISHPKLKKDLIEFHRAIEAEFNICSLNEIILKDSKTENCKY